MTLHIVKMGVAPCALSQDVVDTVVHHAYRQQWDKVEAAVAAGFDVNATHSRYGDTIMHMGAYRGHVDTVLLALSHGGNPNASSAYGGTPLWRAAACGHSDVLQVLVRSGGDVNARDCCEEPPLMALARRGRGDVQRCAAILLACPDLDLGAVVDGKCAEEWASLRGDVALVNLIEEERAGRNRWSVMRRAWVGAVMRSSHRRCTTHPTAAAPSHLSMAAFSGPDSMHGPESWNRKLKRPWWSRR